MRFMEAWRRIWQLPLLGEAERQLARRLDLPLALASAYHRRHPDLETLFQPPAKGLHDPFALPDMPAAVERILTAVQDGERILIYGDFDVDGLTASVLLLETLSDLGAANLECYVPNRLKEGYGVHAEKLGEFAQAGGGLVITVDCGISSHAALEAAGQQGVDVIVTDHHRPGPQLPPARAIVCPWREDSLYPFRSLAGVGVAYKLAQALHLALGLGPPRRSLDLVALGTLADQVPLRGENRALVKLGLEALNLAERPGLTALHAVAGLQPAIDAGDVAFRLAPRLNAAGRLGAADAALELLATTDAAVAQARARELDQLNLQRQELEGRTVDEAASILGSSGWLEDPLVVLAKAGWHVGVLGIAAARLMRQYGRPVILLTVEGESARGSGRSTGDFDLYQALEASSSCLTRYGGHAGAAGLALPLENVDTLRHRLNDLAGRRPPRAWLPRLELDGEVTLGEFDRNFLAQQGVLEPWGEANAAPVFMVRRVRAQDVRTMGQSGAHLSLTLQDANGCRLGAVAFGAGARAGEWTEAVDVAVRPVLDAFQGRERLRLVVEDWRPAGDQREGEDLWAAVLSLASPPLPLPPVAGGGEHLPALWDQRGRELGGEWSRPALAWVMDAQHGHEVVLALRQAGRHAQYYHPGLPAPYRDLLEHEFERGEVEILVTPGLADWRPPPTTQGVWLTPPVTPEQFRAGSGLCSQVVLAFGPAAVERAGEYWSCAVPGRDRLAELYRLLVLEERQARRPSPLVRLLERVKERYPVGGEALLALALQVFGELGIAQLETVNGAPTVILLPVRGGGKLSLQESPAYAAHLAVWRNWQEGVSAAWAQPLTVYASWLQTVFHEEVSADGSSI